jgi:hypothetical protein
MSVGAVSIPAESVSGLSVTATGVAANAPVSVVHGDADPEEVAALVAVLVAHTRRPASPPPHVSGWADRRRVVRAPLTPGPGAWQSSLR